MRVSALSLVVAIVAVVSGCSLNRMTADRTAAMLQEASATFNEEGDLDFVRQALPANIKMLEGLHHVSPENASLGTSLAQGFCSYAFAFLDDTGVRSDLDRAKLMYVRGYAYALGALGESLRRSSSGTLDELTQALSALDKDAVAPLFWAGYCLGNWVNLSKDNVNALGEFAKAEMMMARVVALDDTFYHGSAHLFYAAFLGSRPRMLGGDPKKAKEHLDRVVVLTDGKFLLAQLFAAQYVAVPTQDQALFDSSLETILEAPVDLLPAERFANQIAKRRAAKLQALRAEFF